jgi:hypothetical protein
LTAVGSIEIGGYANAAPLGSSLIVVNNPMGSDPEPRSRAAEYRSDGAWAAAPSVPLTGSRALGSAGDSVVLLGANAEREPMEAYRLTAGAREWERVEWEDPPSVGDDEGVVLVGSADGRAMFATSGGEFIVEKSGAVRAVPESGARSDLSGQCFTGELFFELLSDTDPESLEQRPTAMQIYSVSDNRWIATEPPPVESLPGPLGTGCLSTGPLLVSDGVEYVYDKAAESWQRAQMVDPPPVMRGSPVSLGGGTLVAWQPGDRSYFVDRLSGAVLERSGPGTWVDTGAQGEAVLSVQDRVLVLGRGDKNVANLV